VCDCGSVLLVAKGSTGSKGSLLMLVLGCSGLAQPIAGMTWVETVVLSWGGLA
jgi:hypothetical protein